MATLNKSNNTLAPDYVTWLQDTSELPLRYRIIRGMFRFFGTIAPWPTGKVASKIFFSPRTRRISEKERLVLDSGETLSLVLQGKEIVLTRWNNGPKIVLLMHGWGGNRAQMSYLVDSLLQNNYSVVALDAPAHGDSSGSQTNLVEIVDSISLIQKKFGPIYTIIGHSFGGVASTLAIDRGLEIEKLIMISTPAEITGSIMKPFQDLLNIPNKVLKRIQTKAENIVGQTMEEVSPSYLSKSMNVPLLIIHDSEDVVVKPKDAETIHKNWNNSELFITKGLGHRQILREDQVHSKIISYLER